MHISVEEQKAIVFRLNHDSTTLSAIMHYVRNSFKNVYYYTNHTIIFQGQDELIRKKYLLNWAYKIFYKNSDSSNTLVFEQLRNNLDLPIHIISTNSKSIEKTITINVDHINTDNELRIRCSEYHPVIINAFEKVFKDSIAFDIERKSFRIKIKTKNDLIILKNILSRKKIAGVSVVFITNGLNFSKLRAKEVISEEQAYKNKLQKSYKLLSVTEHSSSKQIKDNYRKMLRQYHPDRVYNQDVDTINLYTRRFQVIQEAYGLIKEHLSL